MDSLRQLLGDQDHGRGTTFRRVSYFTSVAIAAILLAAGLCIYRNAWVRGDSRPQGGWLDILPMVAMAYGSLLLLAVAIIEARVHHVRVGSLVLRARTLDALVAHLTECQEKERETLSLRLHDDIGGVLTALKSDIDLVERGGTPTRADWNRLHSTLDQLLQQIRGLSALLFPRLIGQIGLKGALEELATRLGSGSVDLTLSVSDGADVEEFSRGEAKGPAAMPVPPSSGAGVPSADASTGLSTVDPAAALCVLRIVQEGIVNAGRHARAKHVWVSVLRDDRRLLGFIDDDGTGWGDRHEGMGLTLIRERTQRLGGHVAFESSPQGGARVRFVLPLDIGTRGVA